ncbi:MAG: hypothetical protein JSR83_17750 [Proteobacteria bacterium]|nr:hypothetical protein [Pseudomonadota bacterium]
MEIEHLLKRRQLNVQEQNLLAKHYIKETALAFRRSESRLQWIKAVLNQQGLDATDGILVQESSVPCGGNEQSAYAKWVTSKGQFFDIEATTSMDTFALVSVDACKDVTQRTVVSANEPGTGKSFGAIAIEALNELSSLG